MEYIYSRLRSTIGTALNLRNSTKPYMTKPRRYTVSTTYIVQLLCILFIILFFTSAHSQTDLSKDINTVIFKDGSIVQGQVVQMNTETITIWTPYDDIIIRKFDEVERFVKRDVFDSSPSMGSAITTGK